MALRCWTSLASRVEDPVPCPAQNLWRELWYEIATASQRLRRLATAFQSTLRSPIPQKSHFYFIIRTTVCHVHSSESVPSWNTACTMVTTFSQLVPSGELYRVVAISHWRRFFACIPEGPPERFRQSLRTAQAIYSSSVILIQSL